PLPDQAKPASLAGSPFVPWLRSRSVCAAAQPSCHFGRPAPPGRLNANSGAEDETGLLHFGGRSGPAKLQPPTRTPRPPPPRAHFLARTASCRLNLEQPSAGLWPPSPATNALQTTRKKWERHDHPGEPDSRSVGVRQSE